MTNDLLHGKNIVLIEDNEFLANVIIAKLQAVGSTVHIFKNGLEGLAGIRQHKPDLILLDIMLPIMNGYEVLEVMASEGLVSKYPVLIVSNSGQPVELKRVVDLGAKDYIVKADFTPDEVLDKARMILQNASVTKEEPSKEQFTSPETPPQANEELKREIFQASGEPIKVFVVEDDPMLRNMLSVKFSASKLTYMFINDGAQALELAIQYEPDLILLDLMLPGMNGFEVLEQLKKEAKTQAVPVIVFTNKSEPKDIDRVMELGAVACHVKALTNLNDLVAEIRKIVLQG